jgi:hypothetical protein
MRITTILTRMRLGAALALAMTAACSGSVEDLVGRAFGSAQLTGCYRFDRPYFVARVAGRTRFTRDSTAVLRFTGDTLGDEQANNGPRFEVWPVGLSVDSVERARRQRFSHWRAVGDKEVVVAWRDGFHGPVFRLTIDDDTLRGKMRQTTDYSNGLPNPETWWRSATAVRTPCS